MPDLLLDRFAEPRQSRLWRRAEIAAFIIALAAHLLLGGGAFRLWGPAHPAMAIRQTPPPEAARQFVYVDPNQEEEPVAAETAVAEAAVSRQARDLRPAEAPPQARRSAEAQAKSIALATAGRPAPRVPPRPEARPQPTQATQKRPPPPKADNEPPGPGELPAVARTESEKPANKTPVFVDLRQSDAPAGGSPRMPAGLRAALTGTPSMELLKRRWGAYWNVVQQRLNQALFRQFTLSPMSHRAGVVQIRFGITPNGGITGVRVLFVRDDMLAEKNLCLSTIDDAAPFPPLTAEMQQDEIFQNINVSFFIQ